MAETKKKKKKGGFSTLFQTSLLMKSQALLPLTPKSAAGGPLGCPHECFQGN